MEDKAEQSFAPTMEVPSVAAMKTCCESTIDPSPREATNEERSALEATMPVPPVVVAALNGFLALVASLVPPVAPLLRL